MGEAGEGPFYVQPPEPAVTSYAVYKGSAQEGGRRRRSGKYGP